MYNREEYKQWEKKDVIYIVKNWEKKTLIQMRDYLKVTSSQLNPFIGVLRRKGFSLPSKSRNGIIKRIINEAKQELKLK